MVPEDVSAAALYCMYKMRGRLNSKDLSPVTGREFRFSMKGYAAIISGDVDAFAARITAVMPLHTGRRFAFTQLPLGDLSNFGDTEGDVLCRGSISAYTGAYAPEVPWAHQWMVLITSLGMYFRDCTPSE